MEIKHRDNEPVGRIRLLGTVPTDTMKLPVVPGGNMNILQFSNGEQAEERHQLPSAAVPKVALRYFWMGLNKEKMRKTNNALPFCLYFNNVSFNDRNVLSHKPDSHLRAFCS